DGLVLQYKHHRATFLPSVWQTLPVGLDFVRQLKRKAALPMDFWDADLQFQVYTVAEHDGGRLA
ncbi:MAG: AMMECR1 domain-containing protein, partial [Leptospiraceae bacterium]|nr:AMMECR1 domain-containing protein [Leptospiraceae bacterium]